MRFFYFNSGGEAVWQERRALRTLLGGLLATRVGKPSPNKSLELTGEGPSGSGRHADDRE